MLVLKSEKVDLLGCPSKLCFEAYVFEPHMELLNHF